MTKEEMAARINGCEYGSEISKEEEALAKGAGLVVVFGASDDLMELRGAVNYEADCYNGGSVALNRDGIVQNECDDEDCPYFSKLRTAAKEVKARWCAEEPDGPSWTYHTTIPHATFDILEDGEIYCRGIVFALTDAARSAEAGQEGKR